MGRKSTFTEAQKIEIQRRISNGEKMSDLAKEFGVHKSQMTRHFSQPVAKLETIANQVLKTESEIKGLNISQQLLLADRINHLRLRNELMEEGAHHQAFVYKKLSLAARNKADSMDLSEAIDEDELSNLMKMGMTANTFAKVSIDLKKAESSTIQKDQEKTVIEVLHSPSIACV
jgi:transposase-like protein